MNNLIVNYYADEKNIISQQNILYLQHCMVIDFVLSTLYHRLRWWMYGDWMCSYLAMQDPHLKFRNNIVLIYLIHTSDLIFKAAFVNYGLHNIYFSAEHN